MFISVLLPAPFAPMSAWASPACNGKMGASSALTPAEGLRDAGHIEGGPDHREALPEMRSIQMKRMIAIPFTTRFMK